VWPLRAARASTGAATVSCGKVAAAASFAAQPRRAVERIDPPVPPAAP